MPEENILVHSFSKNATEEIRVAVNTYKGKRYLDIRVFYEGDDGEYKPSKKGIALSPELLPELESALAKLKNFLGE